MDDPRSRARPLAPSSSGAGVPFGRYVLLDRLARGGMGEVFRALAVGARGFEKPVVVKRILPQLASWQRLSAMFAEEAKLMSRLVHPNIVQVIDFGEGEQDDYFLVMELVDGVDLRRFCQAYAEQDARVPVPLALYIAASVLRGLSHAHRRAYGDGRTLVHRDVSPGNVLLSGVGEVKVADFGVALVARPGAEAESGALLVGKPSYMAPEQYRGAPLDARADIFSAGVILYEMLSGALPFAGEDAAACQAAALAGRRRAASALRPELGPDIDALLDIALSAEREKRFAEARAMARAIEALRGRGQKIAGPDELAEAVDAIRRCGADRRPSLVAAGSGADEGGAPVPEPPRHLTRLGEGDDLGQFTLRISLPEIDASVVRELEPGLPPREDEPAPPQRAPGRRGRAAAAVAGALVAALAALGAVWLLAALGWLALACHARTPLAAARVLARALSRGRLRPFFWR
ncbi:MAG: serine/threonine protein kinase, partial [Deltaproteobacteria bacterium]|nr:serine/threonine protein kinase [Deltaproteobacteria bacterium]